MKKILSVLFAIVLLSAIMTSAVSAQSTNPNGFCDLNITIKKADPAKVIKDGLIGDGEYERLDVNLSEDETCLNICYGSNSYYDYAVQMLSSLEYYFSWDDTHGLNFAVRFKPVHNFQNLSEGTDTPRRDYFLVNTGFVFVSDPIPSRPKDNTIPFFYYAVAKNTNTGAYIEGDYEQFGYAGNYDPVEDQDYCITYESAGTVLLEWSVPFSYIAPNSDAGDEIYFSITTTGGDVEESTYNANPYDSDIFNHAYSVVFGDWGWLVKQVPDQSQHVIGTLSAETVSGTNQGGGNNETGDNGGGNGSNVTAVETYLTTDAEGNTVVETRIVEKNVNNNGTNNTNAGKRTGDPMIIIAAVSAVSACGVVVLKKKH